jgi:quercetin 2,3-dioxygenase
MDAVLHKANTRGHANHGWLESWHTFSFAGYYDPTRVHFGVLRVLNDDTVAPGMGFGKHAHDNMEIITIPLEGDLEHEDNLGNKGVIRQGDVQVMSAGRGIQHSEKNKNTDRFVKFLQIWIQPDKRDVTPRYDQKTFAEKDRYNQLQTLVSPMGSPEGINIYQDAWISSGKFDKNERVNYQIKKSGNGLYVFVLEGDVTIDDFAINRRDGLGLLHKESITITADTKTEILLLDVPLQ